MPYRVSKSRKRHPRRKLHRRKVPNYQLFGLTRARNSVMPQFFKCVLIYKENIVMDNVDIGAITLGSIYNFRVNDLWSPSYQVTRQPRGFDELCGVSLAATRGLYKHFTVIGSKITYKHLNTSTKNQKVYIALNDTPYNTANKGNWEENRGCKVSISTGNLSQDKATPMHQTWSVKKDLGLKNPMSNSAVRGSATAGPTQQMTYSIAHAAVDDLSAGGTAEGEVTIEYLVIFSEPNNLFAS